MDVIKNIFPVISLKIVVEQITNLFYNKLSSEFLLPKIIIGDLTKIFDICSLEILKDMLFLERWQSG